MNFVLVNGRMPHRQSFCGLCCEPIGRAGYVRDIKTQFCYCSIECYRFHSATAPRVLFQDRAKVS
jgi:hypothetical protein